MTTLDKSASLDELDRAKQGVAPFETKGLKAWSRVGWFEEYLVLVSEAEMR